MCEVSRVWLALIAMSSISARSSEDSCFALSQNLHSVKFERDSAAKRIDQLHAQIAGLIEAETADQNSLSDHARVIRGRQQSLSALTVETNNAHVQLHEKELVAESLSNQTKKTLTDLRSLEQLQSKMKQEIQDKINEKESVDTRVRNHELRIQMLDNDIDASNHTALDSWCLFLDRTGKSERELNTTKVIFAEVQRAWKNLAMSERVMASVAEKSEKTRRNLASAQEMLASTTRQRDEQQRQIAIVTNRLESDRVEAFAKTRALEKMRNETMIKSRHGIGRVRNEMASLTLDLKRAETELSNLHKPASFALDGLNKDLDLNVTSLHESLKESRQLLSREGYSNRFSLLQSNKTTSDPYQTDGLQDDIVMLRDSSKLLSIEEHIKELHAESLMANQSWNASIEALGTSEKELNALGLMETSEVNELIAKTGKLQRMNSEVASIETGLKTLRSTLADELSVEDEAAASLKETKRKYEELFASLVAANSTLHDTFVSSQNAQEEYGHKKIEMRRLRVDKFQSMNQQSRDEQSASELDRAIAVERSKSTNITETTRHLSSELEEQRKKHTEVMAVISQVSHRLEEKLMGYEEESRALRKERSEVEDLEANIRTYLGDRARLNRQLDEEMKGKMSLEIKIQELNRQVQGLKCDV